MPMIAGKKVSTSMLILASCVLGIGLGLFILNLWHASNCTKNYSTEDIENYIEAINKRLLQSESQIIRNEITLSKLMTEMQKSLIKLETQKLEQLTRESQDEAIKLTLTLAGYPAPPMPDFPIEKDFEDAEKLADIIDDEFNKDDNEKGKEDFMNENSLEYSPRKEGLSSVTDVEADKMCNEWKVKYDVSVGLSWGNLPYDLQQKWVEYSCDYHLSDESKNMTTGNINKQIFEKDDNQEEGEEKSEDKEYETLSD